MVYEVYGLNFYLSFWYFFLLFSGKYIKVCVRERNMVFIMVVVFLLFFLMRRVIFFFGENFVEIMNCFRRKWRRKKFEWLKFLVVIIMS